MKQELILASSSASRQMLMRNAGLSFSAIPADIDERALDEQLERDGASPEEVALYTVRALERNKAIIIPGRRNRWIAFSPRLSPRWLTRKIAGAINKAYCPR